MRQSIPSSTTVRRAASRAAASVLLTATGSVGLLALTAGQADAAPTPPPPIDGEVYTPTAQMGTGCNTALLFTGSQTFTESGTTAGPYPGTFTEAGAVNYVLGAVTSTFTAVHITSTVGKVDIAVNDPLPLTCPGTLVLLGTATVTITTPDGSTWSDNGNTVLSLAVGNPPAITVAISSTGPVTLLSGPPAVTPEAPLAVGLPIAALVVGGTVVARRRRRSHTA